MPIKYSRTDNINLHYYNKPEIMVAFRESLEVVDQLLESITSNRYFIGAIKTAVSARE